MAAKSQDKILLGVAVVVLIASAAWIFSQRSKIAVLRKTDTTKLTSTNYVPVDIDTLKDNTSTWQQPPAQPSGPEWVYDVFTPPEIYYDKATKKFTVTPPDNRPVVAVVEPPFGVQLVQVKQDVFRLQLVGYVGSAGDYRGTFQNMITGDTVIGRAGKTFPDLGLTVRSFDVKRNRIATKESMDIYDTEATAVVIDDKTGNEIKLTNKERLTKGTPFAVLKADGAETSVEEKAGGKLTVGTITYTVVNVTVEPPSAEILKESADLKEPFRKVLTPLVSIAPVPQSETTKPPVTPATPSTSSTPFPSGL